MKRVAAFKTEAALCLAFATVAKAAGWTVYNETGGWDQLLVNAGGEQIGVQAKLRPNYQVIIQAVDHPSSPEPDWRMVLIGHQINYFHQVCHHLNLLTAHPDGDGTIQFPSRWYLDAHKRAVTKRHSLPKYMPDIPAGVPCPVQLTDWKVKAIRLCAILRHRGHLETKDFRTLGVNVQRWLDTWLVNRDGRRGVYIARAGVRLPDEDHPVVSATIRAEVEAEMAGSDRFELKGSQWQSQESSSVSKSRSAKRIADGGR